MGKPLKCDMPTKIKSINDIFLFFHLLDEMNIHRPIPEYHFTREARYRFDFAWPQQRIALEVEGGIWMYGRGAHSRPKNIERDMKKQNIAAIQGWRILRVQPKELLTSYTIEMLKQIIE